MKSILDVSPEVGYRLASLADLMPAAVAADKSEEAVLES